MSTESVSELRAKFPQPPRFVEQLRFVTNEFEEVKAYDVVNALIGVTSALDYGVVPTNEAQDRDIDGGLATAARLLARQLQDRLESDYKPRRREGAR